MAVTPIIRYVNTDNTVSGDGTTNETDGSADSAYTSLNVALQNEKADLVSISSSLTIICSGTTLDSGSNGFVMTVPQDTWYTSEECNVTIKTPPDQRHNGVWDDTKYRLYAFHSLSGSIGNIVLDGLQIHNNPANANFAPFSLQAQTAASGQRVNVFKNCLFMIGYSISSVSVNNIIYVTRNSVPIYFYNNIIYVSASSQQTNNTIRALYSDGSNTIYFYNNTVVGNGKLNYGFDTGGPNYLKNNIFTGTTVESYLGTPTTDEYNATSDGDATGTGARTNQTFSFINPSIDDYRLSSKDNGAARFGADVSNDTNLTQYAQSYTTDIVGTTRTTPWEIGAYQLPYDETGGRVIPKPSDPPKTFPTYIAAVSGTWSTTTENDLTIDVGSGVNRKAVVFLANQSSTTLNTPLPHTCSYEPTGENIRLDRVLDGGDLSQFDSGYYTTTFYYDIPDNDSGTKTFRFNTTNTIRGGGQIVIYKDSLSGAPYTSSVETAATQSAGGPHPFSYVSASLTLDGPSTVVSFALFEKDVVGATLSPLGIETVRGNFNYGGTLGGDVIAGDFKSNKPTITTEYTSSQSGSLVTCTALALQSPGYAPDFKIQRGQILIPSGSNTSSLVVAGVDYDPVNSSSAFIRSVSNNYFGPDNEAQFSGRLGSWTSGLTGSSTIESSFSLETNRALSDSSRSVTWEILEYTGRSGGDNEFIVHYTGDLDFPDSTFSISSPTLSNVTTDNVVPFITSQYATSNNGSRGVTTHGLFFSSWNPSSKQATFRRGEPKPSSTPAKITVVVVEFVGKNWNVQRIEHTPTVANSEEIINFTTPTRSTSSVFLHTQFYHTRSEGGSGTNWNAENGGYRVRVDTTSSMQGFTDGAITALGSGSVVIYAIENIQKHGSTMNVVHYTGSRPAFGTGVPDIWSSSLQLTVDPSTTSIMGENATTNAGSDADYIAMRFELSSSGQEVVFIRSDDYVKRDYNFSTVEWPTEYRNKGISIQSDTQWFYDDFNRADQNITGSSAWAHVSGSGVTVVENNAVLAGPGVGTNSDKDLLTRVSSSVMTFNADQSAEIRFTNLKNGDRGGVAVRLQPDLNHESGSGYFVRSDGQNQISNRIYRIDSGSVTSIGSVNVTVSTDDVMKLTAIGSTISVYVNGTLIDSVTDSTYPTGSTGIYYYYGNLRQTTIDNFYAQNIVSGQTGKPFKIS